MRAVTVGVVEESKDANFPVGISLPGFGHRLPWAPQGTSWLREDDMYLKAAKIPPGGRLRRGIGQSAWDYPQGSECLGLPPGLETLCPCHKKTPTTP